MRMSAIICRCSRLWAAAGEALMPHSSAAVNNLIIMIFFIANPPADPANPPAYRGPESPLVRRVSRIRPPLLFGHDHKMRAAVLGPRAFGMFGLQRGLLAVAHRPHPNLHDAARH